MHSYYWTVVLEIKQKLIASNSHKWKVGGSGRKPPNCHVPITTGGAHPLSTGKLWHFISPAASEITGYLSIFLFGRVHRVSRMGVLAGSGISTLKLEGVATWSLPVLRRTGPRYIIVSRGHRIYDELTAPPPTFNIPISFISLKLARPLFSV